MRVGVLAHVRPALLVAFILVCMLWYITADAGEFNSSLFRPPEPGQVQRAPLPEPGSLAVLGAGVAAVAARFIRRRKP